MELKLISIKNWRNLKETEIHFENLMLFLGQNIEGAGDIFSCILFGLNKTKFNSKNIFSKDKNCILKFIFLENETVFKLKIIIKENINYFLKKDNLWEEISEEEYKDFVKKINLIHIKGSLKNNFKKISLALYNIIKKNSSSFTKVDSSFKNFEEIFKMKYYDKELCRNILFKFFKQISLECLNKNKSLLGNTIILFEEPELYLSPQKERELYNYFIKLTNRGSKIYIKTYSSSFVGLKQYKSICLLKKVSDNISIAQTDNELFKDDEIKAFNMNYWINPDRAELFFAKKVILVEGQTDKIVISFLAKKLKVFKYDYSIIECGSKSTIPQFISLLNNFKIPYIAVFDKDNHYWRTLEEKENSKIKNKNIISLIDKNLGLAISFDNDIEEEISSLKKDRFSYKNKPFNALKSISEENYKLPISLENKIKNIYL